uniref:Uncharacterized protein n=1 Tax=Nelumbo nucifera TaxID=4432 RepID=A0A822XMJ3_NELNU|nr:TPA_asm: hypothetical protein HUJ06_022960 [Nelumbo nucifera]
MHVGFDEAHIRSGAVYTCDFERGMLKSKRLGHVNLLRELSKEESITNVQLVSDLRRRNSNGENQSKSSPSC